MRKQIKQPPKQRYRYVPDLCAPFEAHIGRRMCMWEHALIYTFEKARKEGRAGRFIVVDNDPAVDSRPLLVAYFLWRAALDDSMFVAPTRKQAEAHILNNMEVKSSRSSQNLPLRVINQNTGAARNPAGMRGRTWRHCLLLNSERYKQYDEVMCAAVGPLPIVGDSIMVIHSRKTLRYPPAFTPTGPPIEVGIINETGEPQLIIVELMEVEASRPPQKAENEPPQTIEKEHRRI